ncbi:MAG: hypothetical protein WA130_08050 [Candidatus Methanoperedens sp.]
MTNMDVDLAWLWFILIGTASGIWVLAFLIIWSVTKKQFDALAGVVVFVLGTIFASIIIASWGLDLLFSDFIAFPFITLESLMPALGFSFAVAYVFSKNIRESSTIAFTGTLFFGIFFVIGYPIDFQRFFLPRLLALLASIPVSSVILYTTYCKNIRRSIKGSLLGLSILSSLLSLIIFAFLKFGNCWRIWDYGCFDLIRFLSGSPLWMKAVIYIFIPVLAGVTIIKLTAHRAELP